MAQYKLKTLHELAEIIQELKEQGKIIVQCHGVFDLLHPGHIKHFEAAKKLGDFLIVTVTSDKHVNKGPNRPQFNQTLRMETLAKNEDIDFVALSEYPTAVEAIKLIKPNVYAKGTEYKDATGDIDKEKEAIESVGGKIAFTNDIVFSSSSILNKLILPEKFKQYVSQVPYSLDIILK